MSERCQQVDLCPLEELHEHRGKAVIFSVDGMTENGRKTLAAADLIRAKAAVRRALAWRIGSVPELERVLRVLDHTAVLLVQSTEAVDDPGAGRRPTVRCMGKCCLRPATHWKWSASHGSGWIVAYAAIAELVNVDQAWCSVHAPPEFHQWEKAKLAESSFPPGEPFTPPGGLE